MSETGLLELMSFLKIASLALLASPAVHGALTNANFEVSPFNSGWNVTGSPVAFSPGLLAGSNQGARFSATGQALNQSVTWGADWYVDFYAAVRSTTSRQLSLIVSGSTGNMVNLRYEAGMFATFNGTAFVSEPSLGGLTASIDANNDGDLEDAGDTKNVYHIRLTGRNFGSSAANYDISVSDANSVAFTKTVSGITRWQSQNITSGPPANIRFGSEFGSNPGWWLDEVSQHAEAPPTGPISLPYVENFATGPGSFTGNADWAAVGGVYRNTITAATAASLSYLQTTDLGGATPVDFVLSSKFQLTNNVGTANTVGFALFGTNSAFTGGVANPYYGISARNCPAKLHAECYPTLYPRGPRLLRAGGFKNRHHATAGHKQRDLVCGG
jgi:hypothetical protein